MGVLKPFAAALAVGVAAGAACAWLDTPLPWLIGPLFASALARMAGADLSAPVQVREAGQWAIGTTLGLYFTAPVLAVLVSYAGWIALAVAFALGAGACSAWLLRRLTGADAATSFFAMAAGGASEMAVQGERHGAEVQRVAAAHGLRVMLVVSVIPFGLRTWSRHGLLSGTEAFLPPVATVSYGPLLLLAGLTAAGALWLKRRGVPNAWVIGPLLVALILTASGVELSRLPEWMVRAGQVGIGLSLGTRFTPAFVRTAPRFLGGVALSTLLTLAVAAGLAALMAAAAGLHIGTAILAFAPGGIAEMALTARALHLGVPVVTGFHVMRMLAVVLLIGPAFRALEARAR
ncbi:MAG: AbrB family transcriptional regulator [Telluria sp.]